MNESLFATQLIAARIIAHQHNLGQGQLRMNVKKWLRNNKFKNLKNVDWTEGFKNQQLI